MTVAAAPPSATASTTYSPHSYQAKIARYHAALDAGADPTLITTWITQAQTERDQALAHARTATPHQPPETPLTIAQITTLITELGDIPTALHQADPEHKRDLYRALGLRLTYQPHTETVHATIDLGMHRWDSERVGGGT